MKLVTERRIPTYSYIYKYKCRRKGKNPIKKNDKPGKFPICTVENSHVIKITAKSTIFGPINCALYRDKIVDLGNFVSVFCL
jgi:hypothetical protein